VREVPPGPPDQVPRLERYRQEHPDVDIQPPGARSTVWRAFRDGDLIAYGFTLMVFLDRLEALPEPLGAAQDFDLHPSVRHPSLHRRRSAATELFSAIPDHLNTSRTPVTRSAAITRMRNTCQPPCLRRLSGLTRAGRGFGVGQGRWFRHECSHIRLGAWLWVTSAVDRGLTGWCWWPPRAAMTVIPAGTATLGSARPVRKLQRWWLWDLSDFGRQLRDLRHWP